MAQTLQIIQIASSILLIVLVLLQRASSDTGASLGSDSGSFLQTRRGSEKFIFILTIVVALAFVVASIASVVLFK